LNCRRQSRAVNDVLNDKNRANLSASLGTVRGVLDENRQPLHSTITHFDDASARIAPLLDDLKKTNADAQKTINTLEGTIAGNRSDLRQSVEELRHMLDTANNVTDQLDRTLNANGENIDDILSNFRQASQNLRQFTETLKQRPYTLLRSAVPPPHVPGKLRNRIEGNRNETSRFVHNFSRLPCRRLRIRKVTALLPSKPSLLSQRNPALHRSGFDLVGRLTAPRILRDDRVVYGMSDVEMGVDEYHRWTEPPTEMIEDLLVQQLRHSGQYKSVQRISSTARGDYLLRGHLSSLNEVDDPAGIKARFNVQLELFEQKSGGVVWTGSYSHDDPVEKKSVTAVVESLQKSVNAGLEQLTASSRSTSLPIQRK